MTISFLHTWAGFAYCTYIKMIMFSYMQNPSQTFLQPGRYGLVKSENYYNKIISDSLCTIYVSEPFGLQ